MEAEDPRTAKSTHGQDVRLELIQIIDELYQLQLVTATGGNLSARLAGAQSCWITPANMFKGDLRPEVLTAIDLEGRPLQPDSLPPSSERLVHTEIYKARPTINAVIHAHAPFATMLGLSGLPFLPITPDAAFLKELPCVPFIMPGTRELAEAVADSMRDNPAAILQNHGVVVAGSNLRRAANLLIAVERNCQLILGCYAAGREPLLLPEESVRKFRDMGEMIA